MENRFHSLFQWNGECLEDVRFWCEPRLTAEALEQIAHCHFPAHDGLATFEARGFFLAGQELLRSMNIEIAGAFYLLNAAKEEALERFSFPIHAVMKHELP